MIYNQIKCIALNDKKTERNWFQYDIFGWEFFSPYWIQVSIKSKGNYENILHTRMRVIIKLNEKNTKILKLKSI